VGNSLYGLQGMSSDSSEVRAMLSALVPKVESCREALDAQHVGNSLYGLQGMGEGDEHTALLNYLYDKTTCISGNALLSCKDLVVFGQNLALILPKLRVVLKDEYEQWENVNSIIADELLARKDNSDPFFSPEDFGSKAEQRVYDIIKMTFDDSIRSISSNEYLFNLFESDIVLRVPIVNDLSSSRLSQRELIIIINIEIDGIHHKREKRKRFCMLRDKYLKAKGVVIERIDTSTLRRYVYVYMYVYLYVFRYMIISVMRNVYKCIYIHTCIYIYVNRMKDKEIKEWIQERVTEAQKSNL
jgi:hypothetical protein